jgi:hypothetical protein
MAYYGTAIGIVLTIAFTLGILAVYKYVANPQMVYSPIQSQCPDAWTFNLDTKKCDPTYDTHCTPFDPNAQTLDSAVAKCNVAQSCGTFWPGYCP